MSSKRPDAVTSSVFGGDSQPFQPAPVSSAPDVPIGAQPNEAEDILLDDEDINDPIVRTIDVYISPELSSTLHLLQFPIQPANPRHNINKRDQSNTPAEARFRPKHNMLELEYPIPPNAQGGQRQLPDKMCLSQRTFVSNAVAPVTHMALGKLNKEGTRLNVVPLQKHVLQMRPSFNHLHDEDDDDANTAAQAAAAEESKRGGSKAKPILYQKKETERSAAARRNSYAYKRASEESEEWIELDVHGSEGKWSTLRKEMMYKIKCKNKEHHLKLGRMSNTTTKGSAEGGGANEDDGGYVKSLNYLDSYASAKASGEAFVENLSDWAPSSSVNTIISETTADTGDDANVMMEDDDEDMMETPASAAPAVGAMEQATAELASKLAILLQTGNGTMIPYRVIRSRFHKNNVSDEMLTVALSSCAVLVRGNFALKSTLAKFLNNASIGGGEHKKKIMQEMRDLILLLLNMHGMIQRERLTRAYATKGNSTFGYDTINADTITFVLQTVAKKSKDCWIAKVEDDEGFAADFPEVAARHGMYWLKKKEMLEELIELYENADLDDDSDDDWQ